MEQTNVQFGYFRKVIVIILTLMVLTGLAFFFSSIYKAYANSESSRVAEYATEKFASMAQQYYQDHDAAKAALEKEAKAKEEVILACDVLVAVKKQNNEIVNDESCGLGF